MLREVDKIARRADDAFGPLRHLDAGAVSATSPWRRSTRVGAELFFEIPDLHRQGRLA